MLSVLDPMCVALLGAVGDVPATNRFANTVEKFSGSTALPKSFRLLTWLFLPNYNPQHEQANTVPHKTARKGLYGHPPYNHTLDAHGDQMDWVRRITSQVEPLEDTIYGPRYRCSITLKDGTFLPCAIIQSKERLVELAKRRIKEEMHGRGHIGGEDPYGQIVTTFVAGGNRVNDYDVATASESRFAIPSKLLSRIHGETTMAWTGWVFRMRDGRAFSYGTSFLTEFFQLPDGYEFSDVEDVVNHSFVDASGVITKLHEGGLLPRDYKPEAVFRERAFFSCAVDGV
jgi:hypothetical protein